MVKTPIPRGTPKPKCLTCGTTVPAHCNRYCSYACVPFEVRQNGGRKSGEVRRFKFRRSRFERPFADLVRNGRRLTKEDILDAFAAVYKRGYNSGLTCHRQRVKAAQKRVA